MIKAYKTMVRSKRKSKRIDILIQILFMYIISRDLLVTTHMSVYFFPIIGTLQFRVCTLMILLILVFRNNPFASKAFRSAMVWVCVIVGSLVLFLMVESVLVLFGEGNPHRMIKMFFEMTFILTALLSTYLYATSKFNQEGAIRFILQPYCYLCIYVSITGLLSWILVSFDIVNPASWHIPAEMLPRNMTPDAMGSYYTFPYFLGLVRRTVGSFLGFDLARACGLFHEPNYAFFFVAPAIFLLPLVFRGPELKAKLIWFRAIMVAFLLVVHAVAGMIALVFTMALMVAKYLTVRKAYGKKFLVFIGLILLGLLSVYSYQYEQGTISKKLGGFNYMIVNSFGLVNSDSLIEPGIIALKRGDAGEDAIHFKPRSLISSLFQLLHITLVLGLALFMLLFWRGNWYLAGAMIVCVISSFKNSIPLEFSGIYIYQLFVFSLLFNMFMKRHRFRKPRNTILAVRENNEPS